MKASLDRLTLGLSRKQISERAATISANYRSGGNSVVIQNADDALAYALARMPATYAALAACLANITQTWPDYAPASLLDVGAGPGTATWAAAGAFPTLTKFVQLDINLALRALAIELMRGNDRFSAFQYEAGDARTGLSAANRADFVIASYVLGELPEHGCTDIADALWAKTCGILLVVEPGTPAAHKRVLALRNRLIAAGAHVVAPCPHNQTCPLSSPDWCHFSQRLARSRDHMQVKEVELPFEDEKFAYVALARAPPPQPAAARVLAQPTVTKIEVTTKLCLAGGGAITSKTSRRDKENYAKAKRWRWGDAVKMSG